MSAPSEPQSWTTLRQRIQEYKHLATKVEEKEAEHVAIDPDRTILPKLEDLRPEIEDEANWRTWESRRFDNEISGVNALIEGAKTLLGALEDKIGEGRKRKEDVVAEGWGKGMPMRRRRKMNLVHDRFCYLEWNKIVS